MEIFKTHIGLVVPNAPSTLIKIHELINGVYIMENSKGFLDILIEDIANHYMDNLQIYLDNK